MAVTAIAESSNRAPRRLSVPIALVVCLLVSALGCGFTLGGLCAFKLGGLRDSTPAPPAVPLAQFGFARGFLSACGKPCVIHDNPGGVVSDFQATAHELIASGREVVIIGDCASACALMADIARSRVRIMRSTRFLFHRASDETDMEDSPDISAWVKARGGYPSFGSHRMLAMDFDQARRFWQPYYAFERIPHRLDFSPPAGAGLPLPTIPRVGGFPMAPPFGVMIPVMVR